MMERRQDRRIGMSGLTISFSMPFSSGDLPALALDKLSSRLPVVKGLPVGSESWEVSSKCFLTSSSI